MTAPGGRWGGQGVQNYFIWKRGKGEGGWERGGEGKRGGEGEGRGKGERGWEGGGRGGDKESGGGKDRRGIGSLGLGVVKARGGFRGSGGGGAGGEGEGGGGERERGRGGGGRGRGRGGGQGEERLMGLYTCSIPSSHVSISWTSCTGPCSLPFLSFLPVKK